MSRCSKLLALALLSTTPVAGQTTAPLPPPPPAVTPLGPAVLAPRQATPGAAGFINAYHGAVRSWAMIVRRRLLPVPGRPGQLYLGGPTHLAEDLQPLAATSLTLAFLAAFHPPGQDLEPGFRRQLGREAAGLLRYLTGCHRTGPATCGSARKWGGQEGSPVWARDLGLAAWLLWPRLEPALQRRVAATLAYEADRCVAPPVAGAAQGTAAAMANLCRAAITAQACNMLAAHPRARAWDRAAKAYMYNVFSLAADSTDATPGDDGRPVRQWVVGANLAGDHTLEGRDGGLPALLWEGALRLQEQGLPWLLAGRPLPLACSHHLGPVFTNLRTAVGWSGVAVRYGADDGKLVHTQAADLLLCTMRHLVGGDAGAARLEKQCRHWLERVQSLAKGHFTVRRDLAYNSRCATRLVASCLAHAVRGRTLAAAAGGGGGEGGEEGGEGGAAMGVRLLDTGEAILHRRPDRFASFSWSDRILALTLPKGGEEFIWPHHSSGLGLVDAQGTRRRRVRLENLVHRVEGDSFRVQGTLIRLDGRVVQDFLFLSPAADCTLYVERLRLRPGYRPGSRHGAVIGLDYPPGRNHLTLTGAFGRLRTTGRGGPGRVHRLATDWFNIDDRIGYVIRRHGGGPNLVRYHDLRAGSGPVPKLQEWLSLVGEEDPASLPRESWSLVVTLPSLDAQATLRRAADVSLRIEEGRAICRVGALTCEFSPPSAAKPGRREQ